MSREAALDHSLAWLRLLIDADRRRRAEEALLHGQATLGAQAACTSKEGRRVWEKVQQRLLNEINAGPAGKRSDK